MFTKLFVLDASDTGIGAVLSQMQEDGKEKVIAYASYVLNKPKHRYCATCKELLVVVFMKQFTPYLLGKRFTLRMDHGSLTWLWKFQNLEGKLVCWLECLQEFNFEIVNHRGWMHGNADACHACLVVNAVERATKRKTSQLLFHREHLWSRRQTKS